jgi:HEAT repeat protein
MDLTAPTWLWLILALSTGQAVGGETEEAARQDEQTLREAGVAIDAPALVKFFQDRTLSREEQARLAGTIGQLGAVSYQQRQEATIALVKAGVIARPFLMEATKGPDLEVQRRAELCLRQIDQSRDLTLAPAAARLLGHRRDPQAVAVLLNYLPFSPDVSTQEAVRDALAYLTAGKSVPLLRDALKDHLPLKRAVAAEALCQAGLAVREQSTLAPLLADAEPRVRLRVALGLLEAKQPQAVPVLIDLFGTLPLEETWAAEELLLRLAGDKAPKVTLGRTDAKQFRGAWLAWWKDNAATVDWAKLGDKERALGLTLITQMDLRTTAGRVYEVGPDGKVRWQINGVRYPVDAQVVAHNRVLIAEYLDRRVTERDFDGKILWEKQVAMPIACQRLANGHTFIATRKELLVVDRQGREVFSYQPPSPGVNAARKLNNGDMVVVTSAGDLLWLDSQGNRRRSFFAGQVYTLGANIDVLPNGRVLVPQYRNHKVTEYDLNGKVVWEARVQAPTSAVRLANGHTLAATLLGQRVLELNRNGQEVWEHQTDGRPWRARRR